MRRERVHVTVRGAVQGVGFRPFVHRVARELGIGGWVRNEGPSVVLEAEGTGLEAFLERLRSTPPAGARIEGIDVRHLEACGESSLAILPSRPGEAAPEVVPDRVTCEECLAEVLDPRSRYFEYPFTNCSRCGPRWSIVDRLPYDRANTAMAGFPMCAACLAEYSDPGGRRFHAQPTACPDCGPRLALRSREGELLLEGPRALERAADELLRGSVLALQGLGGFQLLVDGTSAEAVARLRRRKHRPHKPLAVLVADLRAARELAVVDGGEHRGPESELLCSPAGPIVLLASRGRGLAPGVHPQQVEVGLMLPTTPLHHLLVRRVGRPLVCTSGNVADEPLCIEEAEARERLGTIADLFLTHDRPIRRPVDDSVARVVGGAPQVLRLARGYAPAVLPAPERGGACVLATGADSKNALALRDGGRIVVGPHVGDLSSARAVAAMERQAGDLCAFHGVRPERVAVDLHPDLAASTFGRGLGLPVGAVPHHLAHALAGMIEHGLRGPLLAVVWDGAGLGTDGTVQGGEFLRVELGPRGPRCERVAHLRPFRLPGGDAAARDPRRALAGLAHGIPELARHVPATLERLLERGLASPSCTSAGRLFDGVAALLGHGEPQSYEGMAPCLLERDARRAWRPSANVLRPRLIEGRPRVLDWAPTLVSIERARSAGVPREALAAAFHGVLAASIVEVARAAGESTVLLTGGCFQNRVLTEAALRDLARAGFEVLLARRLPPGDGGLAVGQLAAVPAGS